MTRQAGSWQTRFGLFLVVALLVLGPGQANGEGGGKYSGMEREALIKELGLTPEQAKAFQAVGEKFDQSREGIIAGIKTRESDLERALVATKPDENTIKGLVAVVTQGHDQLFQSFKTQRQEEMALLTSIQQGKFILALKKWHERMKDNLGK